MTHSGRIMTCIGVGILVAGAITALDINKLPPDNWAVPKSAGVHTLADATPPLPFIGLPPCRLVDTRGTVGVPINPGGSFAANEARTWTFTGLCGIPVGAREVSLNITVTNTGGQTAFGFVKVWPGFGAEPNVSTLNWSTAGVTESNAAIVPFNPGGQISLRSGNNSSDVIVDTNGYFSPVLGTPTNTFGLSNNSPSPTMTLANGSFSCSGPCGLEVTVNGGYAIEGLSGGTPGTTYGVRGLQLTAGATDSAGVFGEDYTGSAGGTGKASAGVRGESATHFGLLGQSQQAAVSGELLTTSGAFVVAGVLGTINNSANWGVYAIGNIGASGAKPFIEAHPTDASKEIRYVALEGPEAGTYFRGRSQFSHGWARIEVPESFRLVTDEEGLTVQITPIGEMATYAVARVGLDEILVRGSKDVEFFYTVNGVRQAFNDWEVITESADYMPRSADARMPEGFSPEQKRRLIANGTYNEDGTVNLQTAERLGWARTWKEWEERDKALAAPNRAAHAAVK
jgi:hypothetical protein